MKKTEKNIRGITLIALVITVIVLLILAGVTIAALSGDNGILKRATEAKEKTEKEGTIEQIKLAIMAATTEGLGEIDKTTLRSELAKEGFTVEEDEDLPWKVISGNNKFIINEDFTVEEITGDSDTEMVTAAQIAANKEKYYGQVALNYTKGDLTYRIFYVDTGNKFGDGANTIYLKADYKNSITLTECASYIPGGEDLEICKRMNLSWATQRGSIAPESWNNNERAAAWLCSPSQWTDYVDDTKVQYAIGGPSIEMYVASYNDVKHEVGTKKGSLSMEYSTQLAPGYIYKIDSELQNNGVKTNDNTIDNLGYNGMYTKGDYYWLASPSFNYSNNVCTVDGRNACLNYDFDNGNGGTGPLVCLKSDIQVEVEK